MTAAGTAITADPEARVTAYDFLADAEILRRGDGAGDQQPRADQHGRNAAGWRSGSMQKQFDYDYSDDELAQWSRMRIPEMACQARTGIIFFNNHVRGQAPKNARMLMEQLKTTG